MKFFADTAEVKDIQELNDLGLLDGVTTTQVSVPEPPTALVLLGGLLGLAGLRRVRRSKT